MKLKIIRVKGNSMWPRYRDGDYLLTLGYGCRRPQPGDDVVFRHPDMGLILKRISRIKDGRLSFRGLSRLSVEQAVLGHADIEACSLLQRVMFRFRLP